MVRHSTLTVDTIENSQKESTQPWRKNSCEIAESLEASGSKEPCRWKGKSSGDAFLNKDLVDFVKEMTPKVKLKKTGTEYLAK